MNGGSNETSSVPVSNAHKKIHQKIGLLFANAKFLQEVEWSRELLRGLIEEAKKSRTELEADYKNMFQWEFKDNVLTDSLKNRKLQLDVEKDYKIRTNQLLQAHVIFLAKRYGLHPREAWLSPLKDFLLYSEFTVPSFSRYHARILRDADPKWVNGIIGETVGKNFGIEIQKDKKTGEDSVFIQIFNDTSKGDVVKGWNLIQQARDFTFGKKRFYPLTTLDRAIKIGQLDKSGKLKSDWEKQEEIFGAVESADFGKIETQRKRMVKQTRSRYNKRFGTKS